MGIENNNNSISLVDSASLALMAPPKNVVLNLGFWTTFGLQDMSRHPWMRDNGSALPASE